MLKLSEDLFTRCDFCNNDTYQDEKYKLTISYGGYFCLCTSCLQKLKNKIEKVLTK